MTSFTAGPIENSSEYFVRFTKQLLHPGTRVLIDIAKRTPGFNEAGIGNI